MRRSLFVAAIAAMFSCASAEAARLSDRLPGPANLDLSYPSEDPATPRYGADGTLLARQHLIGKLKLAGAGHPSEFDRRLGTSTFLWAPAGLKASAPMALLRQPLLEAAGRSALSQQSFLLGLSPADIAEARLMHTHDLGSGAIIASYQQRFRGLEVFGRNLSVAMRQDLSVVATSGYFAALSERLRSAAAARGFDLTPQRAIATAFADLGGSIAEGQLSRVRDSGDYTEFSVARGGADFHIEGQPRSKRVFFPKDGDLIPAYYLEVEAETVDGHTARAYAYVVSAADGQILFRRNMVQNEQFSYRTMAGSASPFQPFDGPLGTEFSPVPSLDPSTVYTRTPATANLITLQNSPQISTNDPWLAANASSTVGNNVDAYVDLASPSGYQPVRGDRRASTTTTRTFDYPYAVDTDPTTASARNSAIVNLFYINNWLHDSWYNVGFNEAAGNAQTNNLGRGGVAGDPILAEGQDYSGTDNANMLTPADGRSPRMQMYLFSGPFDGGITITTPAIGALPAAPAAFGPKTFSVTNNVVAYTDATAPFTDACTAASNAAALAGKIALIDRGGCDFVVKVKSAQTAGAIGVLVANNVAGDAPFIMGGEDATITTPALMTTLEGGAQVRSALTSGTVTAKLVSNATPMRDGTLDNGIIAHEFFHYVSNRLVNNGSGLSNNQGGSMGEGWGDFDALMLTVLPADKSKPGNNLFQGAYSEAFYVTYDAYFGIRRAPYSTSFSVNPLTFRHIENNVPLPTSAPFAFGANGASNAEVHNAGEIWAETLWEAYAALLNDPRYTFDVAKKRMQGYIIAGLKLTPTSPTFTEARDAILAAAMASDQGDFNAINAAFAKRGMGIYAISPPRDSETHQGVAESFVAQAPSGSVAQGSFDMSGTGDCDTDSIIDNGESGLFTVTLPIGSTSALADGTPAVASIVDSSVMTFANGGSFTLLPVGGGLLKGSIRATLTGASAAQPIALQVKLPELGATTYAQFPSGTGSGNTTTDRYNVLVNYDLTPQSRATDDVEQEGASVADWTVTRTGATDLWQIVNFDGMTGTGKSWWAPSSEQLSETLLTSPPIQVTSVGSFVFSFTHYYVFSEATTVGSTTSGPDGGVVEVSVNGGAWQDVTTLATFTSGGYNGILRAPSGNRPGYVSEGLARAVLNFGSSVAGSSIRLRFHQFSDDGVGNFGWLVDLINANSSAVPPFSSVMAENGVCVSSAAASPASAAGGSRLAQARASTGR